MRPLILAAVACSVAMPAWAMKEGDPGKIDQQMVSAAYNPGQVYMVHVPQGQTTAITLGPTEIATEAFGGDTDHLRATPTGNVVMIWTGSEHVSPRTIFIRSRLPDGTERTYSLVVDAVPLDQANIGFKFTYPADVAARNVAAWRAAKAEREQKAAQVALADASGANDSNLKYVLQGEKPEDWDLLPTREVSDNGTDTHFHFPQARIPIIYAMNPDGKEAVVEPTFNAKTGIATVHHLARVFHLRDGDALLCVFNRAFDPIGVRSATGTVSRDVERVAK